MSKADQIRALMHLPNHVIAERIGHPQNERGMAYIRAVRQRTTRDGHPTTPETHRRWLVRNYAYVREQENAYKRRKRREQRAATA